MAIHKKRRLNHLEVDFSNPKEITSLLGKIDRDELEYKELKNLCISLIQRISFYLYNRFAHDT